MFLKRQYGTMWEVRVVYIIIYNVPTWTHHISVIAVSCVMVFVQPKSYCKNKNKNYITLFII